MKGAVPSPVYTFDTAACDAIIAEHYPDTSAALTAWCNAVCRSRPEAYKDPTTGPSIGLEAWNFFDGRVLEYEIRLNKEPEPQDEQSRENELKVALSAMVRRSHDEAELRALIAADGRFDDDPWIQVDPDVWRLPGDILPDTSVIVFAHDRHSGATIRF